MLSPRRAITTVQLLPVWVQTVFSITWRWALPCWLPAMRSIVPVLAMAGSLARKKKVPASAGTLPTHTPLFIAWLIGVVIIVGALSFLPALALGPIVQQLLLGTGRLF